MSHYCLINICTTILLYITHNIINTLYHDFVHPFNMLCILFVKQALENSAASDKIDRLLQVLSQKRMGKKDHAEKIKKVYHDEIAKQIPCENCCEGIMGSEVNFMF